MAGFDVAGVLRLSRFDPAKTLARRNDSEPPFASNDELAGQALLLDTCVCIDQMQGRAASVVERLVDTRQVNHRAIAIQELMHTAGRFLSPGETHGFGNHDRSEVNRGHAGPSRLHTRCRGPGARCPACGHVEPAATRNAAKNECSR